MTKKILSIAMLLVAVFTTNAQTEISGVQVTEKATIGEESLVLNGAGLREKFWIDLYVGSLYLTTKTSDANKVIDGNEAMAIKLNIVSKLITSEKMINSINEGFEKSTNGNMVPLATKIKSFISIFEKEAIQKGDVFEILHKPSSGVVVYKNGTEAGTIEGLDFKKALFGIWFGKKPADKGLKNDMLGK